MQTSKNYKKLFGVALDPADDPWTIQLKQAWMDADRTNLDRLAACLNPYDAVTGSLGKLLKERNIELAGKFPIPGWLTPKPSPSDRMKVTPEKMAEFFDSGELLEITQKIKFFVHNKILPGIPIMLGVDHSATAGVISALSEKYSPEEIGVIVLDQHFDAIPLSVRLEGLSEKSGTRPVGFSDSYCCGNFWAYLIDKSIVLPENLSFIGVADYPTHESPWGESYRKTYLDFEKRGCSFFRREQFEGDYLLGLSRFIGEKIKTPQVYISIDLDVGSYTATYAARYMDRPGLSEKNIMDAINTLAGDCQKGRFRIAGVDIMEFNMHFLGIETPGGVKDTTLDLVGKIIEALP